jgi:hydrogenase 3 maturation protease
LKAELIQHFKGVKKIVVLGVGAELLQDDAAGVKVVENLLSRYGNDNPNYKFVVGYNAPENFTSIIADFHPEEVIIVDAADLKQPFGSIHTIPVEMINDYTLGTHKLSLIMMIKFLKEVINCNFSVLVVQYKSINFNEKMTKEVNKGVKQITSLLSNLIENYYK